MLKAHSFKLTKVSINIQTMAGNFQKTITHNELFKHFSIKNYNTKKQTPKLKNQLLTTLHE